MKHLLTAALATSCVALPVSSALAQQATAQRPPDKPPVAQGWIDIATFATPGMPGMAGAMLGGARPGAGGSLASLMGSGRAENSFGRTQTGFGSGSFVDVTLRTSRNPNLAEAVQAVPQGTKLAPTLQLKVLPQARPVPEDKGDAVEAPQEKPRGKVKLYWGCGATIRPGQPKVADLSTMNVEQLGEVFAGRRATQRGAHAAPGRPVWPNLVDKRMVPAGASFAGEHAFTGQGVPENFKFSLPPAQDIMPAIALKQAKADGVTQLTWQALPTARAYFIAAMGGAGDPSGKNVEMTIWTSSELPDSGFGLIDYQTNPAVDRWLKDKVLLAPSTTRCDVPKGIFPEGEQGGAMLRMIAYGSELGLAYPPRPADPKVAYEPDWTLKVRVKSVAMTMLGMPDMGDAAAGMPEEAGQPPADAEQQGTEQKPKKSKFGWKDALDAAQQVVH